MELIYVIAADAAQASPSGKFSLLGAGIESIYAPDFPAVQPGFALVVRLRILASEVEQDHKFSIDIIGPQDFHASLKDIIEFRPTPLYDVTERPLAVNLILNMPLLVFPEQGTYDFRLSVDSKEVGSFLLNAQKGNIGE